MNGMGGECTNKKKRKAVVVADTSPVLTHVVKLSSVRVE